jgi:nickel-dependent lactate racemase
LAAPVVGASQVISLGAIDYDRFAGYTGGAETLIPQAAGKDTADSLLRLALQPGAEPGRLNGNPVREEIEEAASLAPLDFILDVVVDKAGQVAMATAGHPELAHRRGCAFLDKRMRAEVARPADIVLASCGGWPHDRSLAACMETLLRLKPLVSSGGIAILAAACPEGIGDQTLAEWLSWADGTLSINQRACVGFKPGRPLAAALGRMISDFTLFLVAEPALNLGAGRLIERFPTAEEALSAALGKMGHDAAIWAVPKGMAVLPALKEESGGA